jgi:hypothetical protein
MQTRDDLSSTIMERLGDAATSEDAELVFDSLRASGGITFDERDGYLLAEGIDLLEVYKHAPATLWRIQSRAGVDFGLWAGRTREDALLHMLAEGGDTYDSDTEGSAEDWIIEEIEPVAT